MRPAPRAPRSRFSLVSVGVSVGVRNPAAVAVAVAVTVALLGACAHPQGGPADALAAFGAAVDGKDYTAAYALMSAEYRRHTPLADFRQQLEAGGADVQAIAHRLKEEGPRTPLQIEINIDLGETLTLVLEGGQWRVAAQPFDLYAQRTPRAALRSFVRAIERRRYDVVVRLVPNRYRIGVNVEKLREYWEGERRVENQKLLSKLRQNVNAPIVETGDEARMPYGEAAEVRFVREDGLWKVEDVD